jgi:hypothetical protein
MPSKTEYVLTLVLVETDSMTTLTTFEIHAITMSLLKGYLA